MTHFVILCRTMLVALVVLLPLLGLTWTFGLLSVNSNTTVFAWLFTIFNSLQVGECRQKKNLRVSVTQNSYYVGTLPILVPCDTK